MKNLTEQQEQEIKLAIGEKRFKEIMEPRLKDNTWYKAGECTIKRTTGKSGFGYNFSGDWEECDYWAFEKHPTIWTEMAPFETLDVLKRRIKELGLNDYPFECLHTGNVITCPEGTELWYSTVTGSVWSEKGTIVRNDKFATPITE